MKTAMSSSSRRSRRHRRDRLSISILPDRSDDTEPQSSYLHWLFGETNEVDMFSRLDDDDPDGMEGGVGYEHAEAVIMREVSAWLELQEHDDFWLSKRNSDRKASQLCTLHADRQLTG